MNSPSKNLDSSSPFMQSTVEPVNSAPQIMPSISSLPIQASQLAVVFQHYETIKNWVTSFVSGFVSNSGNKFYVRMMVMFGTMLSFIFGFVTTTLLNKLFFVNNVINTVRAVHDVTHVKNGENDKVRFQTDEPILDSWLAFSSAVTMSSILDYVTSFGNFTLVKFVSEILKCFLYYKLMTDPTFTSTCYNKVSMVYLNNQWGIDQVRDAVQKVVCVVTDAFSDESRDELINAVKNLKQKTM